MSIKVLKPGILTTVQDLGRYGYQHLGVPVSGAMDTRSHRLANALAGNSENEATLEITLSGPTLTFSKASCIAISGALLSPSINGKSIPNNRPIVVKPGDTLQFGERKSGVRAYMAVFGGIKTSPILESQSTYIRGGFGGYKGRALKKGDVLEIASPLSIENIDDLDKYLWQIQVYLPALLGFQNRSKIRVLKGPNYHLFSQESIKSFFGSPYLIEPQSDRMGYRLSGPKLKLVETNQLMSEAISFGTVQVPTDGNPIILMADRQTTGGYAKIANVCSADLPSVAQTMPGQSIVFEEISLADAQTLDAQRKESFGRLLQSLAPLRDTLGNHKNSS